MKISEQLEWDYEGKKRATTEFMTKDTIKEVVAAELFIPIVEELYDNNIFTSWSGLSGDAHIRIPLDGLSRENYLIAMENCKNNPRNWRVQKPPYGDQKDIASNYTFEIYVDYEDGITELSTVVKKMLEEIRKFYFQDVQIAKAEYAKESGLPRVDLDGLYKRSESEIYVIETEKFELVPAKSFEELAEMYLNGGNPEYFYDEETDTYFRNRELIEKSKEYREYKTSPEKGRERAIQDIKRRLNEKMSDKEKYKVIFDWMIEHFKYDYSILYSTQVSNLQREAYSKYRRIIRRIRKKNRKL